MTKLERDWEHLAMAWRDADCVYGSAVGAAWREHPLHSACEQFAVAHPDATDFLIGKLNDPSPYVAAYAFKCLLRVRDVEPHDVPVSARERKDVIHVQQVGCRPQRKRLGSFFLDYWGLGDDDADDDGDSLSLIRHHDPRRLPR